MKSKVDNFARFYALIKKIEHYDKDELKRQLVHQYTKGRTDSLREMYYGEYNMMCNALQVQSDATTGIKKERSVVLKLMQKCGVDTTSWERVNALCLDSRISGKEFRRLSIEELEELAVKLRVIERKGGFSAFNKLITPTKQKEVKQVIVKLPNQTIKS